MESTWIQYEDIHMWVPCSRKIQKPHEGPLSEMTRGKAEGRPQSRQNPGILEIPNVCCIWR